MDTVGVCSEATPSHVPYERLVRAHAAYTPDTTWAVNRYPPDLSQSTDETLVSMSPKRASHSGAWAYVRICGVVVAPGRRGLTRQPPGHVVNHCPVNHRPGPLRVGFVVSNQPAMKHQPAEGPLDRPALALRLEPALLWFLGDDLHVDAVLRSLVDDALLVPGIHPCHRHLRVLAGHLRHHGSATGGVLHAGRGHQHDQ